MHSKKVLKRQSGEREVPECKAGEGPGRKIDLQVIAATWTEPNAAGGCFSFAGLEGELDLGIHPVVL